jgi:hypothetical protein
VGIAVFSLGWRSVPDVLDFSPAPRNRSAVESDASPDRRVADGKGCPSVLDRHSVDDFAEGVWLSSSGFRDAASDGEGRAIFTRSGVVSDRNPEERGTADFSETRSRVADFDDRVSDAGADRGAGR